MFDSDAEVRIIYHTYPEESTSESKEENSQAESSAESKTESSISESSTESKQESSESESKEEVTNNTEKSIDVYTVDNRQDIGNMFLLDPYENSKEIKQIVSKYRGKTIEMNMVTSNVQKHNNYKTRFDYWLIGYHEETGATSGSYFLIEDVNYNGLHLEGENVPDTFGVGVYCDVKATLEGVKDNCIMIKPIFIKVIKSA